MTRPAVSVVMPFAGDGAGAREATHALQALDTMPGDQLILSDNLGLAPPVEGIEVVRAIGERSPAHARNVGAAHARCEWILFLDADCRAPRWLLDAYCCEPAAADVGALAGEVIPSPDARTVAERYGAARSFLSQRSHAAHPYRPRAVAANLLVRRVAFEQIGGFYEGVRAAEDTDFSWRLQQAGWRLALRPGARVEHRYRTTVRELRRQWRGYAAGRAWLGRRYQGFKPEPAVRRALARGWCAVRLRPRHEGRPARNPGTDRTGRLDRARFAALDAVLAADELAGLTLSNRPAASNGARSAARVVLVADRFPVRADPLTDFARSLDGARVEAVARPEIVDVDVARTLAVDYREDEGVASRAAALVRLVARHPLRCALDLVRREPGGAKLSELAPAAVRLLRDPGARVHPLGGENVRATARRLGELAGRELASRRP